MGLFFRNGLPIPPDLQLILLSSIAPFLPEYYASEFNERPVFKFNLLMHAFICTIFYLTLTNTLVYKGYPERVAKLSSCLSCTLFSSHISRVYTLSYQSAGLMFNYFVSIMGIYMFIIVLAAVPRSSAAKLGLQFATACIIFCLQAKICFFVSIVILVDHHFHGITPGRRIIFKNIYAENIRNCGSFKFLDIPEYALVWIITVLSGVAICCASDNLVRASFHEIVSDWILSLQMLINSLFNHGDWISSMQIRMKAVFSHDNLKMPFSLPIKHLSSLYFDSLVYSSVSCTLRHVTSIFAAIQACGLPSDILLSLFLLIVYTCIELVNQCSTFSFLQKISPCLFFTFSLLQLGLQKITFLEVQAFSSIQHLGELYSYIPSALLIFCIGEFHWFY